jgi:hypothetical protein
VAGKSSAESPRTKKTAKYESFAGETPHPKMSRIKVSASGINREYGKPSRPLRAIVRSSPSSPASPQFPADRLNHLPIRKEKPLPALLKSVSFKFGSYSKAIMVLKADRHHG